MGFGVKARERLQDWFGPHWPVVLGAAAFLVGAFLIERAITVSSPYLAMIGIPIAAGGLVPIDGVLEDLCQTRRALCLSLGVILFLGGIAMVWWAFENQSALTAALAVGFAGLGLLALAKQVVSAGRTRPGLWVTAGLIVAAVGVGLAALLDLHWALGVALIGLGLACYKTGMRHFCEPGGPAMWCVSAGFASTVLGVVLLLAGVFGATLGWVALGLFLLAFGLIALSTGLRQRALRPITPRWAVVTGVGIGVAGVVFYPSAGPLSVRLAVGMVLALIGASFSVRGEGALAVVLAGSLLVFVLVNRVDTAPLDPNPNAPQRILALGDSYTSGEGSTRFFEGTNVIGDNENQCRRSSQAYPYLVASRLGMGLDFYACSGATALQIHQEGQMGEESPDDIPGELPQLDNLVDTSQIRVVLVSIGGNDALFGEIGQACVVPGSCPAFREHWLVNAGRIGGRITDAFIAIKSAVGPSTPVIAVPYPLLISEGGCDWSVLDASEHDFLFELVTVLDDRVRRSAEQAGVNFFEPGLFAFEGQKICNGRGPDDTVMNLVNAHPMQGAFLDRVNPVNWVHGTFHPKPSGHQAIADALTPWLEELLSDVDAGLRPPNPEPNPDAPFVLRQVGGVETVLKNARDLPTTMACPAETSAFATLLPLLDAESAFSLDASPQDPICYTLPDGSWTDAEAGVVTRSDRGVRVQPQLPDEGWTQTFVYKDATEGNWQVRIVEFCNKKPNCPTEVSEWIKDQLLAAAQSSVLPALLIFFGGWLFGLGLSATSFVSRRLSTL
jgi:lysophospholipase L1-like esterase